VARFLNERLVVTPRFSQGGETAAAAKADEQTSSDRATQLVRREEKAMQTEALRQDASELSRRKLEVMAQLGGALQRLEAEQEVLVLELEALRGARRDVSALGELEADGDGARVRRAARVLETAHLELVKAERRHAGDVADSGAGLVDLGFGELTRVGLAMSWPLILTLVALAVLLAVILRVTFAV